jgi:hypothetical protein
LSDSEKKFQVSKSKFQAPNPGLLHLIELKNCSQKSIPWNLSLGI